MPLQISLSARESRKSSEPVRVIVPKGLTSPGLTQKNSLEPARYVLMYRDGAVNSFSRLKIRDSTVMLSVRSATNPSQQTCPPRSSEVHDTDG